MVDVCKECHSKEECRDKEKCIRAEVMKRLGQTEYDELSEINAPSPIIADYMIIFPLAEELNEIEDDDPLKPDTAHPAKVTDRAGL